MPNWLTTPSAGDIILLILLSIGLDWGFSDLVKKLLKFEYDFISSFDSFF